MNGYNRNLNVGNIAQIAMAIYALINVINGHGLLTSLIDYKFTCIALKV